MTSPTVSAWLSRSATKADTSCWKVHETRLPISAKGLAYTLSRPSPSSNAGIFPLRPAKANAKDQVQRRPRTDQATGCNANHFSDSSSRASARAASSGVAAVML